MSLRRAALLAALAAASLTGGACSSGSSESTTPTTVGTTAPPSPRDVFVAQANTICRDMQDKGQALAAQTDSLNDPNALAGLMRQMNGVVDESVVKLRALSPPPEDAAAVADAIDKLERAGKATGALADASVDPNQLTVASAVDAQSTAQEDSDLAMTKLGLTACVFADTPPDTTPPTTFGPTPATALD